MWRLVERKTAGAVAARRQDRADRSRGGPSSRWTGSTVSHKLPRVVGEGAAASHAAELLDMLGEPRPDLAARVTAAIRVGDRRWNLRIDNAIDVLLPADEPAGRGRNSPASTRSSALLQRDVQTIDIRLPDRVVLRVSSRDAERDAGFKKGRPSAKNT